VDGRTSKRLPAIPGAAPHPGPVQAERPDRSSERPLQFRALADAGCQTGRVLREYEPLTPEILLWVARQVHPRARVTSVAPLPGGITADMDRVSVDSPAGLKDVVLRRWPGEDWAEGLVTREACALAAVGGRGVPAPELIAMDEDGAETGIRCTLTSALAGRPDLSPADMRSWLGQLATTQAAIHAVPDHPQTRWDGWYDESRPLDWLSDHGLRDAAREAASGPLEEEKVLVHGDYQHFNVLWCDGRLSGVVDWPTAATGSRGSDVGHCRLNLAVLFDARTAGDYLVRYERVAGVRVDRRADLRALLCFDLGWLRFIPRQVAGRAPLDLPGMPGRVAAAIRGALDGIG
jgi:aminoglycoside phosphotransferase (APT) family kinase protein